MTKLKIDLFNSSNPNLKKYRQKWIIRINNSGINEINKIRIQLKSTLEMLDYKIKQKKESGDREIAEYLKSERLLIRDLLSNAKRKISLINKVQTGATSNVAKKFVEIASHELSINEFQKIMKKSLNESELSEFQKNSLSEYLRNLTNTRSLVKC